jgi:hypothetical protein
MNANLARIVGLALLAAACAFALAPLPAHGEPAVTDAHEIPRFVRDRTEIVTARHARGCDGPTRPADPAPCLATVAEP